MSPVVLIAMGVAAIVLIVYPLLPNTKDEQEAVKRRMRGKAATDDTKALRQQARDTVAKRVVAKVAPLAVRPVMPKTDIEMSRLRIKLATAGFRRDNAPTLFLASKTILGIGLGLVAAILCYSKGMDATHFLGYTVVAVALGFMGPNIWLSMAASKRAQQIRNGLPDSLDLMVISVEAGLGLDAAMQRVGDELKNVHPTLSEEFQIASWETQMGIPRAEALDNFSTRSGVPEVRSLVAIINQAEKFGTSIARALRNQADALRVKRRQKAEETAQKTTVKLMLPLILFIFPSIFVVLVGPAALQLIDTLGNTPGL